MCFSLHFLKIARTYAAYSKEHIGRFVEKRLNDVSKESTASNSTSGVVDIIALNYTARGHRTSFLYRNFFDKQIDI